MATMTENAATRIVAVECSYHRQDGRHVRKILLVPQFDDIVYGSAVVDMRAEKAAAKQVRHLADGTVYTRVHASMPIDIFAIGASAPELVIDDRPAIGHGTPYNEHRFD